MWGMPVDASLQRSATYAVCFIAAAVFSPILYRALHAIDTDDYASAYAIFGIWSFVFAGFFISLALAMRGYIYIGEKFDSPRLKYIAIAYIWTMAAIFVLVSISVFLSVSGNPGSSSALLNGLIGNTAFVYMLFPFALGVTVLRLQKKLPTAIVPFGISAILLMYVFYISIGELIDVELPEFLGAFVWIPVPEALFAIASSLLFFQASKR